MFLLELIVFLTLSTNLFTNSFSKSASSSNSPVGNSISTTSKESDVIIGVFIGFFNGSSWEKSDFIEFSMFSSLSWFSSLTIVFVAVSVKLGGISSAWGIRVDKDNEVAITSLVIKIPKKAKAVLFTLSDLDTGLPSSISGKNLSEFFSV